MHNEERSYAQTDIANYNEHIMIPAFRYVLMNVHTYVCMHTCMYVCVYVV